MKIVSLFAAVVLVQSTAARTANKCVPQYRETSNAQVTQHSAACMRSDGSAAHMTGPVKNLATRLQGALRLPGGVPVPGFGVIVPGSRPGGTTMVNVLSPLSDVLLPGLDLQAVRQVNISLMQVWMSLS